MQNADGSCGDWRVVTYGEALSAARSIGRRCSMRVPVWEHPAGDPTENSIEHALLGLGAMYVGAVLPASTPHSLVSQDFEKLRHVLGTITRAWCMPPTLSLRPRHRRHRGCRCTSDL